MYDKLNYKKQIKLLSHIYYVVFWDCYAILTIKMTIKKHEHRKNYNESTIFLYTYSFYYFKNNKTIYKLFNKIYKIICKKHNAAIKSAVSYFCF